MALSSPAFQLALKHHPDKLPMDATDEQKEQQETEFQKVAQAYEILSDSELRAKYDRGEDVTGNPEQQQQGRGFPQHFFHNQGGGGGGQQFRFHFGG